MKRWIIMVALCSATTAVNAQLTYKGRFKEYEGGMSGISLVQPVAFSPDGKNCYIGSYNGFTWYEVNASTQTLVYKGTLDDGSTGGPGVSDGHGVIVSPDGNYIYLASGYMEHSISVYTRNTSTGAPTYKEIVRDGDMGISNMKYPYGIDMDGDGKNIYVACKDYDGNSLIWFSRNATTGSLTYMNKFVDGTGGINGLLSADDVDLSPDNKNVYVTAFGDDALTWYSRDISTGNLTYGGILTDNTGGVDGLDNPYWVEVSPDGKFAYVGAQDDNSIAWFSRNTTTGALTYVNRVTDGAVLSGARGISIHPTGNYLVASASYGSIVSWYSVNKTTGALSYMGQVKNGVGGVDGIGGTRYNSFSPDGSFFVATGYDDNAVAWFGWGTPSVVSNIQHNPLVSIYPNPSGTSFQLSMADAAETEGGTITICDCIGRVVYTSTIATGQTYNHGLPSGIYTCKIQSSQGQTLINERLTIQ